MFYTKVAGVTFEGRQRYIRSLAAGQKLQLKAEPNNPYDRYAVGVYTLDGTQIGFIPKGQNQTISNNLLNNRGTYDVSVSSITGGGFGSNYGCNIAIDYKQNVNSYNAFQKSEVCSVDDDNEPWTEEDLIKYAEHALLAPFVSTEGKFYELYNYFKDCQYKKIADYFDNHELDATFDTVMYLYGLLFCGQYGMINNLCDTVEGLDEIEYDSSTGCLHMADKLLGLSINATKSIKLIQSCANMAIPFVKIKNQIQKHKDNGLRAHRDNYSLQEAGAYLISLVQEQKLFIPENPTFDDIERICSTEAGVDEKLSYSLAEVYFNQKMYFAAAMCYLNAALANWGDPKYYAYFGQCMLRGDILEGLIAGHEATKIAISLDPTNAEWRIMDTNLLSHIQMKTPFNVVKLYSQSLDFLEAYEELTADNYQSIKTLRELEQSFRQEMDKYDEFE